MFQSKSDVRRAAMRWALAVAVLLLLSLRSLSPAKPDESQSETCNETITLSAGHQNFGAIVRNAPNHEAAVRLFEIGRESQRQIVRFFDPIKIDSFHNDIVHWTRDGYVVLVGTGVTFSAKLPRDFDRARKLEWTKTTFRKYMPVTVLDADTSASITDKDVLVARSAQNGLLYYSPSNREFRTFGIDQDAWYAWDGTSYLVRMRFTGEKSLALAEVLSGQDRRWNKLSTFGFSDGSSVLAARGGKRTELVIFTKGSQSGSDRVDLYIQGSNQPKTLARGSIDRVVLAANHQNMLGYFDPKHKFVLIKDGIRSEKMNAWLRWISSIPDVLDFEIMDGERIAVIRLQPKNHHAMVRYFSWNDARHPTEVYSTVIGPAGKAQCIEEGGSL